MTKGDKGGHVHPGTTSGTKSALGRYIMTHALTCEVAYSTKKVFPVSRDIWVAGVDMSPFVHPGDFALAAMFAAKPEQATEARA